MDSRLSIVPATVYEAVKECGNLASADSHLEWYIDNYTGIPGAPAPSSLTITDAPGVLAASHFNLTTHRDWAGLLERENRLKNAEADIMNPYLPVWDSRTDAQKNVWMNSVGDISDIGRRLLDAAIRKASPSAVGEDETLFNVAPDRNAGIVADIVQRMRSMHTQFLPCLGDEELNPDFAWAPALCISAGLGIGAARYLLSAVTSSSVLPHWISATPDEFVEGVLAAHKTCGYPVGILRCDWSDVKHAMQNELLADERGQPVFVPWLKSLAILHVLKHVRITYDSETFITVAYKGNYARRVLKPEGIEVNWASKVNSEALQDMCSVLQIPYKTGKTASNFEIIVAGAFKNFRPSQLVKTRPLFHRIDLIPAPSVDVCEASMERTHAWINPGIAITNVARLDMNDWTVDKDANIDGTDALVYDWPVGPLKPDEYALWKNSLPSKVSPMRPSEYLSRYIKNRNVLGNAEGANAVLDAILLADLFRSYLISSGCSIGGSLPVEFPPVFVLPTGSTRQEVTNQGKTMMGLLFAKCMVPSISGSGFTESTSPPAQRSMAEWIHKYGTAMFDEFRLPQSGEHFLNKQGIQTLATGTCHGPGRAGENSLPPRLSHPMVFCAQVAALPEDIYNRMYAIVMDQLTPETRSTEADLDAIRSGRAAAEMRLSFMAWVATNGILEKLINMPLASGEVWRFNAHLTIASALAPMDAISAYFVAMQKQLRKQLADAEDSGLTGELNLKSQFDPGYYLDHGSDVTYGELAALSLRAAKGAPLSGLEFARKMIEDSGTRRFDNEIRKFGLTEKAVTAQFTSWLAKHGPYERHNHRITYIPMAKSEIKDSSRRNVAYVEVVNLRKAT